MDLMREILRGRLSLMLSFDGIHERIAAVQDGPGPVQVAPGRCGQADMTQVTELGYLTLGVKRLARWKEFASQILGLEVVDGELPGRAFLRMDYWHHRIVLEENDADDLMLLGFRVAGQEEFGEMAKRLQEAGVAVRIGSYEEAAERHVLQVMMLEDPNDGVVGFAPPRTYGVRIFASF